MENFYLSTFKSKRQARLALKKLSKNPISYSSSYYLDDKLYLVIQSSVPLTEYHSISEVFLPCQKSSRLETAKDLLIKWAISELTADLDFIRFETSAANTINGSLLSYNNCVIRRSYEPLTELMLIINNTPDSFSERGKVYQNIDLILSNIEDGLKRGVSIIDIGAESTRPNAAMISTEDEINRLEQLIEAVISLKKRYDFALSLDSYKSATISKLLRHIDIINDVSGNLENDLLSEIARLGKTYIPMHSLTIPASKTVNIPLEKNPVNLLLEWGAAKLEQLFYLGFNQDQVIIDIGIGFNKTMHQSWYLLSNINKFNLLGVEILVGHSRKSFLNKVTNNDFANRDLETAIVSEFLARQRVDYLRIHNLDYYEQISRISNQLNLNC